MSETTVDDTGRIVEDTSSNIGGGNQEHVFDPTAGQTFYENNGSSSDTSGNVVDKSFVGGTNLSGLSLDNIKKWASDNAGLLGLAGAAAGSKTTIRSRLSPPGFRFTPVKKLTKP